MCYTLSFLEKKAEKLLKRYDESYQQDPQLEISFGFEHPQLPLISERGMVHLTWGLQPKWAQPEIVNQTLNAVSETVFEKPSFRNLVNQRAVLPVSGFFEWHHMGKATYPFLLTLPQDEPLVLACLADTDRFSILTQPADALMCRVHNTKKRMPLILAESDIEGFLKTEVQSPEEWKAFLGQLQKPALHAAMVKVQQKKVQRWVYPELQFDFPEWFS